MTPRSDSYSYLLRLATGASTPAGTGRGGAARADDDPEIGLLLLLGAAAHGDLHDGVDQPRGAFPDGQAFEVGSHLVRRPPELGPFTLTYGAGPRPSRRATSENPLGAKFEEFAIHALGCIKVGRNQKLGQAML